MVGVQKCLPIMANSKLTAARTLVVFMSRSDGSGLHHFVKAIFPLAGGQNAALQWPAVYWLPGGKFLANKMCSQSCNFHSSIIIHCRSMIMSFVWFTVRSSGGCWQHCFPLQCVRWHHFEYHIILGCTLHWPDYVFVGGGIVVVVPCLWLAADDDGAVDLKTLRLT